MTNTSSVLSFLASRFSTHPENLATEALSFILGQSLTARRALLGLSRQLGATVDEDLVFRTQAANEDRSRPDLVGRTMTGAEPVFIEAKFWAGLTERQPVAYLNALPSSTGFLMFVAPAERVATLWPELLRRVEREGYEIDLQAEVQSKTQGRSIQVGSRVLALVTWRNLLDTIHTATDLAGEQIAADIRQLSALCEKMDTAAFIPLRSEELTSPLGQRVAQFCDIADDLTDILVQKRYADVKGLRATGGKGWYGRYLRFKGHGAFLCFDARRWAKKGQSPLWLHIYGKNFSSCTVEGDFLRAAGIPYHQSKGHCVVPIFLEAGTERESVIDSALSQLLQLIDVVPHSAVGDVLPSSGPNVEIPLEEQEMSGE